MIIKLLIEIRFKNLSIFSIIWHKCYVYIQDGIGYFQPKLYINCDFNCCANVWQMVGVGCTRGCLHNVFLRFDRYVGQIDSGANNNRPTSDQLAFKIKSYNCSLFIENILHYSANTPCCLIQWWEYVENTGWTTQITMN